MLSQASINYNIMEKRVLVKSIKDYLGLQDYKPIGVGAGSVSLSKGNSEIIISYSKFPDLFILPPQINGYISFPEVENILKPFYKDHNIGFQHYTIYKSSRRFEEMNNVKIYTPEDIQKVGGMLKTMVFDDILPFFEEFKNLQKVHDYILSLDLDKLGHFLVGEVHLKIMVIKKLLNTDDWVQYSDEVIAFYKAESEGKYKHVFAPIYKFLPDLYEKLRSI